MQACGPLLAQTQAPEQPDAPGILQRLTEKAREAKAKVQDYGGAALGFLGAYYEDHIQPWASGVKSSVWEKIQTYMPLKANSPTD
ncbi:apolipoprotein C-IV [Morone saxatilis]|uniref:apolipoprotein C-IV n=1 Tax=Morone saxatilis TaxID=34816 RepID=UPI0015E20322|nr:apolipoprotein C-IV [Morone saxatilis]